MPEAIDSTFDPYDHITAAHNRLKRDSVGSRRTGLDSNSNSGSSSSTSSTDSSPTTIGFAEVHSISNIKANHLPLSKINSNTTTTTTIGSGGNTPTISAHDISPPIGTKSGGVFEVNDINITDRPRRAPPPPPLQHNVTTSVHPLTRHHSTLGFSPQSPSPNDINSRTSFIINRSELDRTPTRSELNNNFTTNRNEMNNSTRPSAFEVRRQSAIINLHPHIPPPVTRSFTPTHPKDNNSDITIGSNSSSNTTTSTQKKRTSKLSSWIKRSNNTANNNSHNNKTPNRLKISEPILKYSTTDLLPEYQIENIQEQRVLLQRQSHQHLDTNTSLKAQRRQSTEYYSSIPIVDRRSVSIEHVDSSTKSYPSIISINSKTSPAVLLSAQLDKRLTLAGPNSSPIVTTAKRETSVPSSPASIPTPISEDREKIKQLEMKLKESDEKRRTAIIEYQQKLDSERKRTLDLQKRIEQLKAEKFEQQPPIDPKSRLKMIESQRDALRTALNQLREAKEIEITEYRSRLDRLSRPNSSNSFGNEERSKTQRQQHKQNNSSPESLTTELPPILRCGISPLLPIGQPVYFEKIKINEI